MGNLKTGALHGLALTVAVAVFVFGHGALVAASAAIPGGPIVAGYVIGAVLHVAAHAVAGLLGVNDSDIDPIDAPKP